MATDATIGFVMGELVMGRWHWCPSTFAFDVASCQSKAQRGGLNRGIVCRCTITTFDGHPDCVLNGTAGYWKGHIHLIPNGEEDQVPFHRREPSGPPREVHVEASNPTRANDVTVTPAPPIRKPRRKRYLSPTIPSDREPTVQRPKKVHGKQPCLRCGRLSETWELGGPNNLFCCVCRGRRCFECDDLLKLDDEFICAPCRIENKLKMDRRVTAGNSLAPRQAIKMV